MWIDHTINDVYKLKRKEEKMLKKIASVLLSNNELEDDSLSLSSSSIPFSSSLSSFDRLIIEILTIKIITEYKKLPLNFFLSFSINNSNKIKENYETKNYFYNKKNSIDNSYWWFIMGKK